MKNFLEKVEKKGPAGRNDKIEKVTGLGRRTREEIAKWNQMTALRFKTGGGDIRHPRPPFGGHVIESIYFIVIIIVIIIIIYRRSSPKFVS